LKFGFVRACADPSARSSAQSKGVGSRPRLARRSMDPRWTQGQGRLALRQPDTRGATRSACSMAFSSSAGLMKAASLPADRGPRQWRRRDV